MRREDWPRGAFPLGGGKGGKGLGTCLGPGVLGHGVLVGRWTVGMVGWWTVELPGWWIAGFVDCRAGGLTDY